MFGMIFQYFPNILENIITNSGRGLSNPQLYTGSSNLAPIFLASRVHPQRFQAGKIIELDGGFSSHALLPKAILKNHRDT
jgi:hypothetical protein